MSPLAQHAYTFLAVGALLYAGAFGVALWLAVKRSQARAVLVYVLLGIAFAVQSLGLLGRGEVTHRCPIGDIGETLHFIAWSLMVLYFVTGPAFRLSILGLFTAALAALLTGGAELFTLIQGVPESGRPSGGYLLEMHASLAFFSYGALGLLAVTGGMYLLQYWSLRAKRWRGLFGLLPSIGQLEAVNARLLIVGTGVLSVAMTAGLVYWVTNDTIPPILKLIFTLTLWAGYLVALGLYLAGKLRERHLAGAAIVLYVMALLTLLPVEYGREQIRAEERAIPHQGF